MGATRERTYSIYVLHKNPRNKTENKQDFNGSIKAMKIAQVFWKDVLKLKVSGWGKTCTELGKKTLWFVHVGEHFQLWGGAQIVWSCSI